MTESLSRSAYAADTDEVWLILLTISHPDISPPIRVVNNTTNITSRGEEFIGYPFNLTLPDEQQSSAPRARISIDNVSREIGQAIRSIRSAPTALMEVIRAADPDTVERSWPAFRLQNVTWTAGEVTGDLTIEDFTAEPYPAGLFSPASFPGLF